MIYPTKEVLEVFKKTPGALSVCESVSIINIASQAPVGKCAELGTHKGKSAMSACAGLGNVKFMMVDPIFEDDSICKEIGLSFSLALLPKENLRFYPTTSLQFLETNTGFSYIFVDSGSHQDGLPMQEVKLLEDRIVKDGIIAFHDYKSQFKEVEEAYDYLLSTGKYSPINIRWPEIIQYVKDNDLERDNSSWHHPELEFPCFVGAVKRK